MAFSKLHKQFPNAITAMNLMCGSISIFLTSEGHYYLGAWLIIIAAVFDFFDGFAARMLKAYSEFGKQFDSLSDLISFGVAPAMIVYQILKSALLVDEVSIEDTGNIELFLLTTPTLLVLFSAIRLGVFNVDTRQTKEFRGIPTPANALLIASLPLILTYQPSLTSMFIIINTKTLLSLILVQSALMVLPFRVMSLKISGFDIKKHFLQIFLILSAIALIVLFKYSAIPMIYFVYLILSLSLNFVKKPFLSDKNLN